MGSDHNPISLVHARVCTHTFSPNLRPTPPVYHTDAFGPGSASAAEAEEANKRSSVSALVHSDSDRRAPQFQARRGEGPQNQLPPLLLADLDGSKLPVQNPEQPLQGLIANNPTVFAPPDVLPQHVHVPDFLGSTTPTLPFLWDGKCLATSQRRQASQHRAERSSGIFKLNLIRAHAASNIGYLPSATTALPIGSLPTGVGLLSYPAISSTMPTFAGPYSQVCARCSECILPTCSSGKLPVALPAGWHSLQAKSC